MDMYGTGTYLDIVAVALMLIVNTITCAMRYKYVMKYNLESSMKTVGDKFEKEK